MTVIKTVIKFYESISYVNPFLQITELQSCEIKQDVNGFNTMFLTVSSDNENIRAGQKIELYEVKNNFDILIFSGYVDSVLPGITDIVLNCKSQKALMKKKIVLSDKNYVTQTVNSMILDLLNDWNTAYNENWTLDSDIIMTASKDFKIGDDLYGIINELAGLVKMVWTVENQKIKIKSLLGEDKTSGSDFTEIVYNTGSPLENNITDIKVKDYSNVSNIIIGIDASGTKQNLDDAGSRAQFGPLAEIKKFRDGDLTAQTQAYLDSKKARQYKYAVKIEPNSLPDVNIGDKIYMRIEGANDYLDTEGEVIVNTLYINYKLQSKIVEIGVSDSYVYELDFINKINDMNEQLALMKI